MAEVARTRPPPRHASPILVPLPRRIRPSFGLIQGSSLSKGLILNIHSRHPSPPRILRGGKLILTGAALLFVACDEEPARPPSQQAVEHAQERADQAVRQTVEAEQQVRHARRLRDIDRMRYETHVTELKVQQRLLHSLLVGLSFFVLATMIWLAIEIRRRRILSAVIHNTLEMQGDPTRNDENSPTPPS